MVLFYQCFHLFRIVFFGLQILENLVKRVLNLLSVLFFEVVLTGTKATKLSDDDSSCPETDGTHQSDIEITGKCIIQLVSCVALCA